MVTKRISLNGKNPENIGSICPEGIIGITVNKDGSITAKAKSLSSIKELEKKIPTIPSHEPPIVALGKHVVSIHRFLDNMWNEYEKIKEYRRPVVIVLECNIHFFVDELLKEYEKRKAAKGISLKNKVDILRELKIIDNCTASDLINVVSIRNYYAHNIIFDKEAEEIFFETMVKKFHCLGELREKQISIDNKFGKCCYRLLTKLMDKYVKRTDQIKN